MCFPLWDYFWTQNVMTAPNTENLDTARNSVLADPELRIQCWWGVGWVISCGGFRNKRPSASSDLCLVPDLSEGYPTFRHYGSCGAQLVDNIEQWARSKVGHKSNRWRSCESSKLTVMSKWQFSTVTQPSHYDVTVIATLYLPWIASLHI